MVFGCLKAAHAQEFLLAILIDGLSQHMSSVEYHTILRYRIDAFEEHAAHCRDFSGFKYKHDLVKDVLVDIFRRAGISVNKEAHVNYRHFA
ncbi:auxilin-like protein [Trifolium pratense]|uniref:Auxilin-like protein n=1 Tax=Trifolium pratense TaxID=57577 RepID=A0A2K3MLN2_TRIPR|nr:auxilin-like protein [Trifolium pratense]